MARLSRKTVTTLRWIGAPLAFLGAFVLLSYLAAMLMGIVSDSGRAALLAIAPVAGAFLGFAVLAGARTAPRRPRWWIGLMIAIALLVVLGFVAVLVGTGAIEYLFDGAIVAAGLLGLLATSLVAWPGLPPRVRQGIFWALLPFLVATQVVVLFVFDELRRSDLMPGGSWVVADPLLALVVALTVYVAGRTAPARRRLVVAVFAPAMVLFDAAVTGPLAPVNTYVPALPTILASLLGAAVGIWTVWRDDRPAPTVVGAGRRYKGMTPFQDAPVDRRIFFGRDREARSLLSLVLAERLVVLFGKSGMGKTSLINAGLVEPLRQRGYFPMVVRLADREKGPLGSLYDGVREAARRDGVDLVEGDTTSALSFFRTAEIWSESDDLMRPVLILDQFEELFTLHDPAPRREFVQQLAELVRGPAAAGREVATDGAPAGGRGEAPPDLKIVLALREDFLAELEELARDIPGVLRHRFRLGPFVAESAREAIVGPAVLPDEGFTTASFSYREDAVDRIVTFLAKRRQGASTVEGAEVEPAHLQLVCQYLEESLHERRERGDSRAGAEITSDDLGGDERLGRILEGFYDRTLAAIRSPPERRRVRRLCERRLVSEGGRRLTEDGEEIERRLGVGEERLRQLVDARLLRSEPRLGGLFYELSHDTLVEPIRRSRLRRRSTRRKLALAGGLVVAAWLSIWWASVGWAGMRDKEERLALDDLREPLPRPGDAEIFETLAREKLNRIYAGYPEWVRSRELYGGMVMALAEVEREHPNLLDDVDFVRSSIRPAFVARHRLSAPGNDEVVAGNPLILVPRESASDEGAQEEAAVRIQAHPVTNAEYRRFDPSPVSEGGAHDPVVLVTALEAAAYADWLGGRLPTRREMRQARETQRRSGAGLRFGEVGEWLTWVPGDEPDLPLGTCPVDNDKPDPFLLASGVGPAYACRDGLETLGFRVVFPGIEEPEGAAD